MITVGLDFGTHQTKICIEDSTNPNQKTYEFFEFKNVDLQTYFLPSVVQINTDNTVSYGFIDEERCKVKTSEFLIDKFPNLTPPIPFTRHELHKLNYPNQPIKANYPIKPSKINYPIKKVIKIDEDDWKSKLFSIKKSMDNTSDDDVWIKECKRIDRINRDNIANWQKEVDRLNKQFNNAIKSWELECKKVDDDNKELEDSYKKYCSLMEQEYLKDLKEYNYKRNQFNYLKLDEVGCIKEERLVFHYFKFALYSKEIKWFHQLDQETISIWYLCNVLFLLRNKLGEDFYTQMGIPCGIDKKFQLHQKQKALCLLKSAYDLLEHYQNHESFLNAEYGELFIHTRKNLNITDDDLLKYGINVLPEAYAGLVSLTQKRRLPKGMNLLIDIGGGTTDIAFFTITDDDLPDIHSVQSIHKGLNFIYENFAYSLKDHNIVKLQLASSYYNQNPLKFKKSISLYRNELNNSVKLIIGQVKDSFLTSSIIHGLHISRLNQALNNRPVIFSGGGSTLKEILGNVENFSDIRKINRDLLSISTLKSILNDDKLFPILATAYGLSIPVENDIVLTDIGNIFNHIIPSENANNSWDYNHGITDL